MADSTVFSRWCRDRLVNRGFHVSHVNWQEQFNRVSVDLGTEFREKMDLATTLDDWQSRYASLEGAVLERDEVAATQATALSVLHSQLAAEQRSNQALRGVVTRLKKSREKAVREVKP